MDKKALIDSVIRRWWYVDFTVKDILLTSPTHICKSFGNYSSFFESVFEIVLEDIYGLYFYDVTDNYSTEWLQTALFIRKSMEQLYGNDLKTYYHINCGD